MFKITLTCGKCMNVHSQHKYTLYIVKYNIALVVIPFFLVFCLLKIVDIVLSMNRNDHIYVFMIICRQISLMLSTLIRKYNNILHYYVVSTYMFRF